MAKKNTGQEPRNQKTKSRLLAGSEEPDVVVPPVVNVEEAQATPAIAPAQERADEVAVRVPPDLASGHDGELPLEFGVMLPDGAEFGRPFGFQTQFA